MADYSADGTKRKRPGFVFLKEDSGLGGGG